MPANRAGFTLVELMVTIAVVAIFATLAFPSFQSTLRSNRVATASNEMLASLSLARMEAIRSTKPAVICASNADGSACGTDWNQGWIVWVDANGDSTRQSGEAVVRYVQPHPRLSFSVASSGSASTDTIRFDSRGRPNNGTSTRVITLKPEDCPAGLKMEREMTLSPVGQVNTVSKDCT